MPKVQSLRQRFARQPQSKRVPLWDGPESNSRNGGISQSLISRWLICRERFRIHVIEGLRPTETWNQRLGYGEMWHICEESFAKAGNATTGHVSGRPDWTMQLHAHAMAQCQKYPLQQEMIYHWYRVCLTQFPIYVKYWSKNKDVLNRTPLLQEQTFNVPYRLPSGRIVYLRGKWDEVDMVKRAKKQSIRLGERKTKGDIDEQQLQQQLLFDLQTGVYSVALDTLKGLLKNGASEELLPSIVPQWKKLPGNVLNALCDYPFTSIDYSVVRRPLSGGVGSIKKSEGTKGAKCSLKCCKVTPDRNCEKCGGTGRVGAKPPETDDEFYARLGTIIDGTAEGSPGPSYFFMRWNVDITGYDIEKFKREFLNPCLESLCVWYDHVSESHRSGADPFACGLRSFNSGGIHYRTPFGIYNPLAEGGATDVDSYLAGGDGVGLVKAETLFRELE